MASTRLVLAVLAIPVLVGATLAYHRGREGLSLWLLTVGFGITAAWSATSIAWAETNETLAPPTSYLALGLMAVIAAVFFARLAVDRQFFDR